MTRYHPLLVALHWLLALMIILALVAGSLLLEPTPNSDPDKIFSLRAHMSIGIGVLVLMVVRVATRFATARPPEADAGHPLLTKAGGLAHRALYLLVFAMVFSGIAMSIQAGLPGIVFGGEGSLPESFDIYTARAIHGLVASLLMVLIIAHVAAALYHQVYLKDGLFRRMWFGARN